MTSPLQPGAVVDGKYRLTRRIGEGGMGTVFEGENLRIKRKVAIKVLHEHVATSPEFAQRFVREARASARIGSEHVCDVLDLGDLESGEKYIVMELLEGESLEARLERDRQLTPEVLAAIVFEILEGLGAMHQVGVVHRDLKPANVFLCTKKGGGVSVKILDFGVAKVAASEDEDPSGIVDMTTTGTMMGTPLYMSPEQARGARDVDGRTDLYAASVIFYQGLTGETPHSGVSLHELLFKIVLDDPKPIKSLAPSVDDEIAEIVMRGLARDPDQRYSSARQYQEAIAAWGEKNDLSFKVTLPSAPPPLRKQTGGFPAAIIETAGQALRTGNTPLSTDPSRAKEGPPTPIDVHAPTQPSSPPAPPPTSATVRAASSAKIEAAKPGDTLIAGAEPPPKAASVSPTPAPASEAKPASAKPAPKAKSTPPAEPQGTSKLTIAIGILVVIAAAIIGVKLGTPDAPTPTQPSASVSSPPPPPVPTPLVPSSEPAVVDAAVDAGAGSVPVLMPNNPIVPAPKPSAKPGAVDAGTAAGRTFRIDAGF